MENLSRCSVEVDVCLVSVTVVGSWDHLCTLEKVMQD